jgi:hypothetical protein
MRARMPMIIEYGRNIVDMGDGLVRVADEESIASG